MSGVPRDCPPVIRASSAPLAMLCPASVRRGELVISREHEASAMGTAAHDAMACITTGLPVDVADMAAKHGVAADELGMLVRFGRRAWEELRGRFEFPESEVYMEAPLFGATMLSGHADLMEAFQIQKRAVILDWKFGRLDVDHRHQMMAYAALVCEVHPNVMEVDLAVVWLRDQEIEQYRVTREEVETWHDRFFERVVDWNGEYHPGEHCAHCPRAYDCPAMTAMVKRDVEVFATQELDDEWKGKLAALPDAQLVALRRRAKVVDSTLKSLDEAIRLAVRQRGELDSGDGQVLKFVPVERREVSTIDAWPVLSARFSDEEMAAGVDVRLSRFEKMAAEKAGKGKGAAAVRGLNAALDEAGAIRKTSQEQLRLIRK